MLLGVVAQPQTVARQHLAAVGRLLAGEQPQQRGLARAVEPEDHHPAAPVDRPGPPRRKSPASRRTWTGPRRSAGCARTARAPGTASWRPCRSARTSSRPASSVSARARHVLARPRALVALAPILAACRCRAAAFFSALARSRRRRFSSVRPCFEVALPGQVVEVDLGTDRVQVPDLVDHRVKQVGVVADHHEAALVARRKPRSQVIESASRWLVGSSSNSVVAERPPAPASLARTGCGQARPGAAGRRTACRGSARAPGRQGRGVRKSGRPRSPPRTRRAPRTAPRCARTPAPRVPAPRCPPARPSRSAPSPYRAAACLGRGRRAPGPWRSP